MKIHARERIAFAPVHKSSSDTSLTMQSAEEEVKAYKDYMARAEETQDPQLKQTLMDIAGEELVHLGEFLKEEDGQHPGVIAKVKEGIGEAVENNGDKQTDSDAEPLKKAYENMRLADINAMADDSKRTNFKRERITSSPNRNNFGYGEQYEKENAHRENVASAAAEKNAVEHPYEHSSDGPYNMTYEQMANNSDEFKLKQSAEPDDDSIKSVMQRVDADAAREKMLNNSENEDKLKMNYFNNRAINSDYFVDPRIDKMVDSVEIKNDDGTTETKEYPWPMYKKRDLDAMLRGMNYLGGEDEETGLPRIVRDNNGHYGLNPELGDEADVWRKLVEDFTNAGIELGESESPLASDYDGQVYLNGGKGTYADLLLASLSAMGTVGSPGSELDAAANYLKKNIYNPAMYGTQLQNLMTVAPYLPRIKSVLDQYDVTSDGAKKKEYSMYSAKDRENQTAKLKEVDDWFKKRQEELALELASGKISKGEYDQKVADMQDERINNINSVYDSLFSPMMDKDTAKILSSVYDTYGQFLKSIPGGYRTYDIGPNGEKTMRTAQGTVLDAIKDAYDKGTLDTYSAGYYKDDKSEGKSGDGNAASTKYWMKSAGGTPIPAPSMVAPSGLNNSTTNRIINYVLPLVEQFEGRMNGPGTEGISADDLKRYLIGKASKGDFMGYISNKDLAGTPYRDMPKGWANGILRLADRLDSSAQHLKTHDANGKPIKEGQKSIYDLYADNLPEHGSLDYYMLPPEVQSYYRDLKDIKALEAIRGTTKYQTYDNLIHNPKYGNLLVNLLKYGPNQFNITDEEGMPVKMPGKVWRGDYFRNSKPTYYNQYGIGDVTTPLIEKLTSFDLDQAIKERAELGSAMTGYSGRGAASKDTPLPAMYEKNDPIKVYTDLFKGSTMPQTTTRVKDLLGNQRDKEEVGTYRGIPKMLQNERNMNFLEGAKDRVEGNVDLRPKADADDLTMETRERKDYGNDLQNKVYERTYGNDEPIDFQPTLDQLDKMVEKARLAQIYGDDFDEDVAYENAVRGDLDLEDGERTDSDDIFLLRDNLRRLKLKPDEVGPGRYGYVDDMDLVPEITGHRKLYNLDNKKNVITPRIYSEELREKYPTIESLLEEYPDALTSRENVRVSLEDIVNYIKGQDPEFSDPTKIGNEYSEASDLLFQNLSKRPDFRQKMYDPSNKDEFRNLIGPMISPYLASATARGLKKSCPDSKGTMQLRTRITFNGPENAVDAQIAEFPAKYDGETQELTTKEMPMVCQGMTVRTRKL